MNCHLLVPELFWPASSGIEPYRDLALPALEAVLARGRRVRTAGSSIERWLAAAYRLPAELPLAPFSLRGDDGDPGVDCWLRADPVHLKVHGDHLILADASRLAITAEEAREFIAALNPHFAGEGVTFVAPSPHRWYARMTAEPRMRTTPTTEVAGRSVEPFLPGGDDGARWRKSINEAQMLLHEHPCNGARETRGELTVNSVWFWGAGRDRRLAAPYDATWADHPLATGLAAAARSPARRLPASGAMLLSERYGGTQLAVLATLPAAAYGDLTAWRETVAQLERSWFAPLLEGLQDGALESITLHGLGPDYGYTAELTRRDCWRFWRVRRPLQAYAT